MKATFTTNYNLSKSLSLCGVEQNSFFYVDANNDLYEEKKEFCYSSFTSEELGKMLPETLVTNNGNYKFIEYHEHLYNMIFIKTMCYYTILNSELESDETKHTFPNAQNIGSLKTYATEALSRGYLLLNIIESENYSYLLKDINTRLKNFHTLCSNFEKNM